MGEEPSGNPEQRNNMGILLQRIYLAVVYKIYCSKERSKKEYWVITIAQPRDDESLDWSKSRKGGEGQREGKKGSGGQEGRMEWYEPGRLQGLVANCVWLTIEWPKLDLNNPSFYLTYWMHVQVPDRGDMEMNKALTSWSPQSSREKQHQNAYLSCTWCHETGKEWARNWASGENQGGLPEPTVIKAHN